MDAASLGGEPFGEVFDAVVVGSGYAAYAATLALRRRGRSVLLMSSAGDVVWESARGFCPEGGTCDRPDWELHVDAVARRGGVSRYWIDGAIAEMVATDRLVACGARFLYYARPVGVERDGDLLNSMIVATKSGLRRVAGRQWVDATERGDLLKLLGTPISRQPARASAYLMLQHKDWSSVGDLRRLRPTAWPTERVLSIDVAVGDTRWRDNVLTALADLEAALGSEVGHVSLSHLSFQPVLEYDENVPPRMQDSDVANVAHASPGHSWCDVKTLADRFLLGDQAAADLERHACATVDVSALAAPIPPVEASQQARTDVLVAGVGTGGAVAALAAASAGAKVLCVDPLPFVGGVGTGGGIHCYWFGVAGGLQRQVDRRTRELMKRFSGGPLGDGPFNPWAKMIALERLLRESAVEVLTDTVLVDVNRLGDRVVSVLVSAPDGVTRIEAGAFIDATGDGDLCAFAGAEFSFGREHDGLLHAYSQPAGQLQIVRGRPRMRMVNFDAGFCDPTNAADLTRARLVGVYQHLIEAYDNLTRPTYIAPHLGIRESRQISTEYVLTLDDQVRHRRFHDPIGYSSAYYDNHATDYEFESDDAVFWVWANRQFMQRLTCELTYRMLIPRGLVNVWIASRCFGVSKDAHAMTRMQRDVQRAGEAAGFAAASAVRSRRAATSVYPDLRRWLENTGALDCRPQDFTGSFGLHPAAQVGAKRLEPPGHAAPTAAEALAALDHGEFGLHVWWLYRNRPLVQDAVMARLKHSAAASPVARWLAAAVAAMWSEPAAEPRLLDAIESLEYGFGGDFESAAEQQALKGQRLDPLTWNKLVPNWLCAIVLLRRCGTHASIPVLQRLVCRTRSHGLDTLTSVALTIARIAERHQLPADASRRLAADVLQQILATQPVRAFDYLARDVGRISHVAINDRYDAQNPADVDLLRASGDSYRQAFGQRIVNAYSDHTWQLHLAVARARCAIGLEAHPAANRFVGDGRAPVRDAFRAMLMAAPNEAQPRRMGARRNDSSSDTIGEIP